MHRMFCNEYRWNPFLRAGKSVFSSIVWEKPQIDTGFQREETISGIIKCIRNKIIARECLPMLLMYLRKSIISRCDSFVEYACIVVTYLNEIILLFMRLARLRRVLLASFLTSENICSISPLRCESKKILQHKEQKSKQVRQRNKSSLSLKRLAHFIVILKRILF